MLLPDILYIEVKRLFLKPSHCTATGCASSPNPHSVYCHSVHLFHKSSLCVLPLSAPLPQILTLCTATGCASSTNPHSVYCHSVHLFPKSSLCVLPLSAPLPQILTLCTATQCTSSTNPHNVLLLLCLSSSIPHLKTLFWKNLDNHYLIILEVS